MKKTITSLRTAAIIALLGVCGMAANAVIKTVGGTGADYATLNAAFAAVNTGTITGEIVLQLTGNSSESDAAKSVLSLNASSGTASYSSILIYPTADNVVVQGDTDVTLAITLNGADNVTIDGRKRDENGNILSQNINLSINGKAGLLTFSNAATNNTIKYCNITVKVASAQAILFMADSSGGSDNNTLENNNIGSPGIDFLRYGIVADIATVGNETDNLTIKNNNFSNCIRNNATSSSFIKIDKYSRNFLISGNSFYVTSAMTLTNTSATLTFYGIEIVAQNNSGHIIENNYVGGNNPLCGGTAMQINKSVDGFFTFIGIGINKNLAGATKFIVRNNTIANIELGAKCTSGALKGITLNAPGNVDAEIGLVNANFIAGLNVLGNTPITGIDLASGSYTLTNNIISIISDATVSITGLSQNALNNSSIQNLYNNTVYIGGTTLGINNSYAYYITNNDNSNKKVKNNIFVNVRSGAGKNYAFYSNNETSTPVQLDFNNYFVNGTNGVLGYMGAADINSLPFKTGVTDANSKTVNPNFTISSPTIALDYKPTVAELQSGGETDIAVTTDYAGTARTSNQMGAFVVNAPTNVNAVKSNIRVYQQNNGSSVIVADLSSLSESSAVSVIDLRGYVIFNETVEPKMLSIPLFEKGIYFVRIQSNKENATTKVLLF
jgi:hypothetical protein